MSAKCICPYTDPSTWLSAASCGYGGGYEPGSMQEWNPDCPEHPPTAGATFDDCPGICGDHHWLDRPESDTREFLICGAEALG